MIYAETTSLIRTFEIADCFYLHIFDLADDTVRVYDEAENLKLTFDVSARAISSDGTALGHFFMDGGYDTGKWVFQFRAEHGGELIVGYPCRAAEGLLDSEVLVAKAYVMKIMGL